MDKNGHKMGKKALIKKNLNQVVDTTSMNVVLNFWVIWSSFDSTNPGLKMRAKKGQMYK